MITSLKIKDFQGYKEAEIYPGKTTIISGRNNSGKTAILRALRLVCFNRPDGADFVRHGAKDAVVEIAYDDHVIRRIKGKQNVYELDDSTYSNFGKSIPQEIADVLGFSTVQVDRNFFELNYGSAHEAPFFVSETDATKGKIFSKLGEQVLGDLVLLDKSINTANATVRKLGTEKTVLEKQRSEILETLKKFVPLDDLEVDIKECEGDIEACASLEEEIDYLKKLRESVVDHNKYIVMYESLCSIDINVDSQMQKIINLSAEIKEFSRLQSEIINVEQQLEQIQRTEVPEAIIKELEVSLQGILELDSCIETYFKLYNRMAFLESKIVETEANISIIDKDLVETVESYKGLLLKCKKCPICFQDVSEHDLNAILEEL